MGGGAQGYITTIKKFNRYKERSKYIKEVQWQRQFKVINNKKT